MKIETLTLSAESGELVVEMHGFSGDDCLHQVDADNQMIREIFGLEIQTGEILMKEKSTVATSSVRRVAI